MASRPVDRRVFLQRAFAFSAAATLSGCARGISTLTNQNQTALNASAAEVETTTDIMFLGDWGSTADNSQSLVATAMESYISQQRLNIDALLLLGDNFYDNMPGGATSSLWQTLFEQMYPKTVFNCPAYAIPGNHDYQNAPQSKVAAELAYAAAGNTRWTMPSLYYTFTIPVQNPLVTVIALDSNSPNEPANPAPPDSTFFLPTEAYVQTELQWFTQQIQQPLTTPFLVVMAHHPVYSNGIWGDNETLVTNWDPLLRKYGAHLYLAGHNHDLEHLEFAGHPTSFVGSGGGGAGLTPETASDASRGPFYDETHGFTHLNVTPTLMTLRHIDPTGKILHAFTKTPSGVVTILS